MNSNVVHLDDYRKRKTPSPVDPADVLAERILAMASSLDAVAKTLEGLQCLK